MPRQRIKPTVTSEVKHGSGEVEVERHPAYAQIRISRVQGSNKLYGSALDRHEGYMTISIRHSERYHDLSRDWLYGHGEIIEVALSAAQFADLITTPNIGMGVPCTLQFHSSEPGPGNVPGIDWETETEARKVVDGFKKRQTDFVKTLKAMVKRGKALLDKKSVNKGDRESLRDILDHVLREVESNRPFIIKQFQEAAEKVVSQGKAEVEAFVTQAVTRLGLTKLSELQALAAGEQPRQLIEGEADG